MSREFTHITPNGEFGVRVYTAATVVFSLAASVSATYALHQQEGNHTWTPEVWQTDETVRQDTVTEIVGPEHVGTRPKVEQGPAVEDKTVTQNFAIGKAQYARQYEQDQAVEVVDQTVSEYLHDTILGMQNGGWSNFRLTVQGHASAEDDMTRPDAGVQTASPADKNVSLADARADALIKSLKAEVNPEIPIEKVRGTEASLNDDDYSLLQSASQQFGYDSVSQMVEAWNTGKDVPPSVGSTLESLLGKDRSISITVTASRVHEVTPGTFITQEAVCKLPVTVTNREFIQGEPFEAPIPQFIPIPIPVILPIIRRRKSPESVIPMGPGAAGAGDNGAGTIEDEEKLQTPSQPNRLSIAAEDIKGSYKSLDKRGCAEMLFGGLAIAGVLLGGIVLVSRCGPPLPPPELPKTTPTPPEACTSSMPREHEVIKTTNTTIRLPGKS